MLGHFSSYYATSLLQYCVFYKSNLRKIEYMPLPIEVERLFMKISHPIILKF